MASLTNTLIHLGVPGVIGTLLGVFLGWWLTQRTNRDQREWAERQIVRERQEASAAALDDAITNAARHFPGGRVARKEARQPLIDARAQVLDAWSRSTVLRDPELDRRVHALHVVLD